ncbi:hypothetical protein M758_7G079500 [Ceratodon purpureus]|nr:hypothetical protein M758_7G079500 [Ceratodon purpureus]
MVMSLQQSMMAMSMSLGAVPVRKLSALSSFAPLQGRCGMRLSGRRGLRVVAQQTEAGDVGTAGVAAIAGGLVANPVVAWSLYTLKTTGCGLPPGPFGLIGAVEGVSYLVVLGTVGWSTYTKVKTGSGLPSGPSGLLGAVEGFSYLSLLAILVVFGLQYLDLGFIPGPVPSDMCFGSPS